MGNKIGRRQAVDEEHTRPQGLYQLNQLKEIDLKKLRKLILDYKLAPCCPGADEGALDLDECPICFLYYPSLNRSRCCRKMICTECLLQLKASRSNKPTNIRCPFCKTTNYLVEYRGARTKEEKRKEQVEEQRVVEAQIRMRTQELQDEEEHGTRKNACSSGGDFSRQQPSSHDFYASPSISPTEESRSRVLQGEGREGGIRYATSNLTVDSRSAPFSLSESDGAASHLIPDNLEERMMLAMAVSLAEFRAWARGSPGLAWLQ